MEEDTPKSTCGLHVCMNKHTQAHMFTYLKTHIYVKYRLWERETDISLYSLSQKDKRMQVLAVYGHKRLLCSIGKNYIAASSCGTSVKFLNKIKSRPNTSYRSLSFGYVGTE